MEPIRNYLTRPVLVLICLLLPVLLHAAKPEDTPGKGPDNSNDPGGGGDSPLHQEYFTANPYTGTQSCLGSSCHDKEAEDVLATGHWNWQGVSDNLAGLEGEVHGKRDMINNFCVAVPTNEGRCAQCHIGYGYTDTSFDFSDATKIDCLVCHDQTGTYIKGATTAGLPEPAVDLNAVARSVGDNGGVPGRINCTFCHANAGGGDNVKHGDISMALIDTTREFDVHMGTDGGDMRCVDCHDVDRDEGGQVASHGIGGMPYHSVDEGTMKACSDCHQNNSQLHAGKVLQMVKTHDRLACQVCHIPAIARQVPTKTEWYWSDAGDLDRVPVIDPVTNRPDYDPKKGSFVWEYDVRPALRFHNGKWKKTIIGVNDTITQEPLDLGSPAATREDADAMIYPFKLMTGNQVADNVNNRVQVPHLFKASTEMPNPYWGVYDWDLSLWDSFSYPTGQAYSGDFGFVATEMLLAVNHEIAPAEVSLGTDGNCLDCHAEGLIDWPALGWENDPYESKRSGKPQ
ncbi:MAG: tetrathionate reductase family octaheme c-type cytochrome [Gammaproteobacteria bacterium]